MTPGLEGPALPAPEHLLQPAHVVLFPDRDVLAGFDDGRGHAGDSASNHEGGGRGLIGMKERVRLFGGELDAGPRAEGGFRVHARLPIGVAER